MLRAAAAKIACEQASRILFWTAAENGEGKAPILGAPGACSQATAKIMRVLSETKNSKC